jgi:multidrug efflux pump subunit AcrB
VPQGQEFQYTMTTLGRLVDPEQFADMILKYDDQGRLVRLRDVARIELGAQAYDQTCTLNGQPSVALSVYQLPGSNALKTAGLVRAKMEELKTHFTQGVDYKIVYDTTPFINESINEVFVTLRDAVLLVAFVVLLFLQNWRSAIIPLIAVPVAVIGTFAVMAVMGFSLNNLTLFGLVLAIGIVVDDAIVVVEAVQRQIDDGLPPRQAAIKAMSLVSGPVIAVGLVLSAVFVPCAFITGITGQFFRQFALTIAVSTVISAFNSLTLSPALAAILLRRRAEDEDEEVLPPVVFPVMGGWLGYEFLAPWCSRVLAERLTDDVKLSGPLGKTAHTLAERLSSMPSWAMPLGIALAAALVAWIFRRPLNHTLAWLFRRFNVGFDHSTNVYARWVGGLLRVSAVVLVVYGGLLGLTWWGFTKAPAGFIPSQDKGYLLVNVQLPDAASVERTEQVMHRIEALAHKIPGVKDTVAIAGQSMLLGANAPNFGAMYVMLDDFHHRVPKGQSGETIAARLQNDLQQEIKEGEIHVLGAPPIDGLGTTGGFKVIVEDRGDNGLPALQHVGEKIVEDARRMPALAGLVSSFRADAPWLSLDVDRSQAKVKGVSMGEVLSALQVYLGSLYVNDFNRSGRTWQVNVQADSAYRKQLDDIKQLKVRNDSAGMVPLATVAKLRWTSGPVMIQRYNMYAAIPVNGMPAPGVSSGEAIRQMEEATQRQLGQVHAMNYDWTELAKLQLETGNTAMYVFVLAVVLVFLVLAAQYESWSLPLAVILVVPMCLLCSIAGVILAHLDVNIFTQIGFVVLVGLACKNAILIVEYAKRQSEEGKPRHEATTEACKLRLRPIMMTSLAFILGVVPLVISTGAGAEMRRTLGTAVFAGMLGVTLFGIFLTPVFYNVIQWYSEYYAARTAVAEDLPPESELAG